MYPPAGKARLEEATIDSDDRPAAPGTRIGVYQLVRQVGQGSFGTVYEARHTIIGKRAAIKVLARRFSAEPGSIARFIGEARVVNEIHHPSIVDIYDFGELPGGQQYFVMEYLDGPTLAETLERRGKLPPEEALPLLLQVGSALDAAHRLGVVHRDVKPANVMIIDRDGTPTAKLIDFGVAKLGEVAAGLELHSRPGDIVGTPRYMAPEQCRGKVVDHRADVYAWGLIAHEMLTGTPAFDGENPLEIMMKQVQAEPPPVSRVNPDLPAAMDALVLAALRKRPSDRSEEIVPLAEALAAARHGGSRKRPPPRSAGRWFSAAVAAALGGLLAWSGAEPARPSRPATAPSTAPAVAQLLPPAVAAPASVQITLEGLPAGTRVTGADGAELGTAPGAIVLPRATTPTRLRLVRHGYAPLEREVVPAADVHLDLQLAPLPRQPARRPPASRADRHDPESLEPPRL